MRQKSGKRRRRKFKKQSRITTKDPESKDFDGSEYFGRATFTAQELENFSVGDKGITFKYDYEFPHVALALQPDGAYFYSWAELKPFIKRGGLIERFIR